MKFIRKNGRVIPILDDKDREIRSRHLNNMGKTATMAGAAGFVGAGVANMGRALKSPQIAAGATVAATAMGIGNMARAISKSRGTAKEWNAHQKDKKAKTSAVGNFGDHLGAAYVGSALGAGVGAILLRPGTRGVYKAAKAIHKFVKPQTAKFADWRKFKNAVKVGRGSGAPALRKLLK